MPAAEYNFTIDKGETFDQVFTWKDENGTLIDLTGYHARMQVRETHGAEDTILDLSDGDGITLGGVAGTITFNIPSTTTAAIEVTKGVYDLELVAPSGRVKKLIRGTITFRNEVT